MTFATWVAGALGLGRTLESQKNGTMMIEEIQQDRFTVPKTQGWYQSGNSPYQACNRRSQESDQHWGWAKAYWRSPQRVWQNRKAKMHLCFSAWSVSEVKNYGDHFTVDSIRQMWDAAIKARWPPPPQIISVETYLCLLVADSRCNPAFAPNQMGHADAQMVFQVYGKWMSENNNAQSP